MLPAIGRRDVRGPRRVPPRIAVARTARRRGSADAVAAGGGHGRADSTDAEALVWAATERRRRPGRRCSRRTRASAGCSCRGPGIEPYRGRPRRATARGRAARASTPSRSPSSPSPSLLAGLRGARRATPGPTAGPTQFGTSLFDGRGHDRRRRRHRRGARSACSRPFRRRRHGRAAPPGADGRRRRGGRRRTSSHDALPAPTASCSPSRSCPRPSGSSAAPSSSVMDAARLAGERGPGRPRRHRRPGRRAAGGHDRRRRPRRHRPGAAARRPPALVAARTA